MFRNTQHVRRSIRRAFVLGALLAMAMAMAMLAGGPTPAHAGAAVPKVAPGWTIELVAEAPRVRHPTMMTVTPDGRLLVAEDPMDISLPAHEKAGRILAFHPDGRMTVFAEGLHAVFGLLYLEGKVIVHHSPRLTVFEDGGDRGLRPRDLVPCTNPKPWESDWNDHVPANLRLAMDGYLYMSVGDKGIYGAVGTDGSRAELHGGGILRLRPDGSALEVFSVGTRNHLDVAIDAEDELFTYDNTDEKNGWWTRVTHMVDGGDYGYPYDWKPPAPWVLPAMTEYGGGAPTAGFAYLEDAIPGFAGDLFLVDFGKRLVHRLQVARKGATFEVRARHELIVDPPAEFRPVGLALHPDGRTFFLGDWAHRDVKAKVTVGRVWKLTAPGPTRAAPKPGWFLDAALGRPVVAADAELIAGLRHPAGSVRMHAQRQLAARGGRVVPALAALALDGGAPPRARWHALWALDGIDEGRAAAPTSLRLAGDPLPSVRRQALRQLGTRRTLEARAAIEARLRDEDPSVRFQAATALGRLAHRESVPALLAALGDDDAFARHAVSTALRRLGQAQPDAWPAIVAALDSPVGGVPRAAQNALREVYDPALLEALGAPRRTLDGQVAALTALAALGRRPPPWRGEWWNVFPLSDAPRPPRIPWAGTPRVAALLAAQLSAAEPARRRAAAAGLAEVAAPETAAAVRRRLAVERDPAVLRALLGAAAALGDAGARPQLARLLQQRPALGAEIVETAAALGDGALVSAALGRPALPTEARAAAARAAGSMGLRPAVPALVRLAGAAKEPLATRQDAIGALGRLGGPAAVAGLTPLARAGAPALRRAAVVALGTVGSPAAVPVLLDAFAAGDTRTEAAGALARTPDARATDAYLFGLASANPGLRAACRKALGAVAPAARPRVEERLRRRELPTVAVAELKRLYGDALGAALEEAAAADVGEEAYLGYALAHEGEPSRGRALFFDTAGVACSRCHKVAGEGGDLGPELTTIGAQFARRELVESVLFPSKVVREGYQQTVLTIRTGGHQVAGFLRGETADALVLLDAEGQRHHVWKSEVLARAPIDGSLMPDGLHAALSMQDFADLIAYLESLRGAPAGGGPIGAQGDARSAQAPTTPAR